MTLFLEQLSEYAARNADMRPFIKQVLAQEFAFLRRRMAREQERRDRAAFIRERAIRKATR